MKKPLRNVRRRPPGRDRRPRTDDLVGEGGPEEAVVFIAESLPALVRLARRHKLDLLGNLR